MKTVLITGGSEGIGFELAKLFAQDHDHVVLVSHNDQKLQAAKEKIEKTCDGRVDTFCVDLSQQDGAVSLYEQICDQKLKIDILVNNAGMGLIGESWKIPIDQDIALMNLNVVSLMTLTKLFLKDMIAVGSGEVVNICSTGAFQPGPYISSYYASKAFVLRYTKAVAQEAKSYGVKVYCFCLGPVKTGFYEKMHVRHTIGAVSSQQAARYVYTHRKKRVVSIPGLANKLMYFIPETLKMKMIGKMKKKLL